MLLQLLLRVKVRYPLEAPDVDRLWLLEFLLELPLFVVIAVLKSRTNNDDSTVEDLLRTKGELELLVLDEYEE